MPILGTPAMEILAYSLIDTPIFLLLIYDGMIESQMKG